MLHNDEAQARSDAAVSPRELLEHLLWALAVGFPTNFAQEPVSFRSYSRAITTRPIKPCLSREGCGHMLIPRQAKRLACSLTGAKQIVKDMREYAAEDRVALVLDKTEKPANDENGKRASNGCYQQGYQATLKIPAGEMCAQKQQGRQGIGDGETIDL
jgi:hypothetical protein